MKMLNDIIFFVCIHLYQCRRNIQTENATYLKTCNYDRDTDPLCPIFKLGKIVELANVDFDDIAYKVNFCILGGFP